MTTIDPSTVWDEWTSARRDEPVLAPAAFARRYGSDAERVIEILDMLSAVESEVGPPPLVDLFLRGGEASAGTFAGFRIERSLGQGSSGIVFLATDERPGSARRGEHVALKVLNPLLAASPERRASILREAEIAGTLDHPGIVSVLASGVERGYAWIATEWIDGTPLDRLIGDGLGAEERTARALDIGIQLARALAYAHGRGVVHRDLKPANLILSRRGVLCVLDFGLARSDGTAFTMSRTGEAVGTPLYMAPEQARGEREVGPPTDVYAVGLILYELASGEKLVSERDLPSLLGRIASGRFRVPAAWMRRVTEPLRSVIARCLEPHPADRYQDCVALEADLSDVRDGRAPRLGALSSSRRWCRRSRRNPWRAAALSVALVALTALGREVWWMRPVPVYFHTQLGGKALWIDDELIGIEPQTVAVRPGVHTWRAHFGDKRYGYTGSFEVRNREPAHFTLVLDPTYGVTELEVAVVPKDVRFAWVQVSTPLDKVDLVIDGVEYAGVPGISAFRLPLGSHTVVVEAEGCRPYERTVDLRTQELCMLTIDPDRIDSPWHTVLLYSPVEWIVREGMIEMRDLRTYFESEAIENSKKQYVNRCYWGPAKNYEDGSALFSVDLPVPVGEIDVEVCTNSWATTEGATMRLEMGPSPESLVTLFDERYVPGGGLTPNPSRDNPVDHGRYARPEPPQQAKLNASMRGKQKLFVRASCGNAIAGDSCGYAGVMHSHAFPDHALSGELIWSPAICVKVKKQQ